MDDMHEAGRKADATKVRNLYRVAYDNRAKNAARQLAVLALVNAEGTRCLDLWGGGLSADAEIRAGLSVLSVDNGYELDELDVDRRKRALRHAGEEGGYDTKWGQAKGAADECDVAFLDFCGPASEEALDTVIACRHMKAVVVTFTTGHDIHTGAPSQPLRERSYRELLRFAFGIGLTYRDDTRRRHRVPGVITTLCEYRNPAGRLVFVFLCRRQRSRGATIPWLTRVKLNPKLRAKSAEESRKYRERHPDRIAAKHAERSVKQRAETAARREAKPPLICPHCGCEFRSFNYQVRFCSKRCQANAAYDRRCGRPLRSGQSCPISHGKASPRR